MFYARCLLARVPGLGLDAVGDVFVQHGSREARQLMTCVKWFLQIHHLQLLKLCATLSAVIGLDTMLSWCSYA